MAKYNYKKAVQGLLTKNIKTFKGKDGLDYIYKIDDVFSEEKKQQFIKDFISIKKECVNKKENPNYEMVYEYLIIRHFTDALSTNKKSPYDSCLDGMDDIRNMNELDVYMPLLLSINQDEIKKLNEDFKGGLVALDKAIKEYIAENKDVFDNGERKSDN